MNRAILALVAAAFCLTVSSVGASATAKDWTKHKGKIKFMIGSKKGIKKAEGQKKPMMLFFTATW